jgi:hypothetical protein
LTSPHTESSSPGTSPSTKPPSHSLITPTPGHPRNLTRSWIF